MTYPTVGEDNYAAVCPYLGLGDDADSHATYATEAHRCYRLPTPTRIATGHQETYCLGENHVQCPVYRGEGIPTPAGAAGAAAAAGGAASAAAGGRPRPEAPPTPERPPAEPARGAGLERGPQRPRRPAPGAIGPRPRAGGISMPVATVGLFAAAAVIILLAFLIQRAIGGDGDDGLSPADTVATNQALKTQTPQPGGAARTTTTGTATPGTATPGTATPGTTTPATTTPAGSGARTYTVKAGDTCGAIAAANNVTPQALIAANPSVNSECSNLQVGQVLQLP
ncbi:MAG: LysM peptidoglycan-binding domain-containing protein [Tepidiformaceae bacterium]